MTIVGDVMLFNVHIHVNVHGQIVVNTIQSHVHVPTGFLMYVCLAYGGRHPLCFSPLEGA